ncbi:M12 family metallopeptidase [Sphingobacterium sp. MYb382]|uniref:M12 family metallopeptidase n=1 Tax=Sphingobacterium sp. MYb382 TaxID=2745278 RepID=UPI003094A7C5
MKKILILLFIITTFLSCKKITNIADDENDFSSLPKQGVLKFNSDTIYYSLKDGLYYLDDDYYLEPIQLKRILARLDTIKNARGLTIDDADLLWPNGTIPYTISSNLPNPQRIYDAINKINAETGIKLIQRSDQKNYVEFVSGSQSQSPLGKVGGFLTGKQKIELTNSAPVGTVIHEIFHAAGLMHEHQRSDAIFNISIDFSNIKNDWKKQYQSRQGNKAGPFNINSIMNYGSRNSSAAIDPNKAVIYKILSNGNLSEYNSNRDSITYTDKLALRFLYEPRTSAYLQIHLLSTEINEQYTDQSSDIYDVTRNYRITFHSSPETINTPNFTSGFMKLKILYYMRYFGNGPLNLESYLTQSFIIIPPNRSYYDFSLSSRDDTYLGYYQPSTYMEHLYNVEVDYSRP